MTAPRLVIIRHRAVWRDILRGYNVLVDGRMVAKIGNGQEIALDITPGTHRIQIRIDWTGSRVVEFDAVPDVELKFEVRPAGTLLGVYWRVLTRTHWVDLRLVARIPTGAEPAESRSQDHS